MDLDAGLVGHWKFAGNCDDSSPSGLRGKAEHVDPDANGPEGSPGAARFDGARSIITVAPDRALDFGTGDFSVAAWVHTEDAPGDVIGDIVSKYDPDARKGFNFNIVSLPGVTSSFPNDRHVHFGIDDGRIDDAWRDCGRPGNATLSTLAVFDGDLYAGTLEPDAGQSGHVYRYLGEGTWESCGSPAQCNNVGCLAVYDGALYCGVSKHKLSGHCLPDSPNPNPGGMVFRYAGGAEWTECGRLDEGDGVHCMTVFRGTLYATPLYDHGVFAYCGGSTWEPIGPDARVMCMGFWNGRLYALTSGVDSVYRLEDDGTWSDLGRPADTRQLYSFAVYQGTPYIGTWPFADVFRHEADETWTKVGTPGYSRETMGMAVYNGKLYAGVLPMAAVYRYDKDMEWAWTGTLDSTPDVQFRRAWSLAVYEGKLFCGTLPRGKVYSIEAGRLASSDRTLEPGWRHLAAVRRSGRLEIAVDGEVVAKSSAFAAADYDLTNAEPLKIGFGAHDHFKGLMSDLRIYNRALTPDEVSALARPAS